LKITWKSGVSIEHDDVKVILDPQSTRFSASRIFVTHGHLDHSKAFKVDRALKFSTKETMEIVSSYGLGVENWKPLIANKKVTLDDTEVIPRNSGHILGSCEFEIVTPEGNILFTGDLNTEETKTMKPAIPVQCDVLILESTFGSPSFIFPSEDLVAKEMVDWARKIISAGKIPTFQTDSLGNAQEIVGILNEFALPVITHWKVSRINRIYESWGHKLKYFDANTDEADEVASSGNFVYITPKQLKLQDHPEFVPALVSGWALWSKRKAFPLSDHADFPHLTRFVEECNPKIVLTCHGNRFNETFARYIEKRMGIRAYPINLIPTNVM
jgi:Cft2 family RNA processing exonuclease